MELDGSAGCRQSALRSACLCAPPGTWSPAVGRRDHVLCVDVRRMARSTCQVLEMIAYCRQHGVALYDTLRPSAQAISRRMPSSTPTCASHPSSCLALVGRYPSLALVVAATVPSWSW